MSKTRIRLAALAASALLAVAGAAAQAGECPTQHRLAKPRVIDEKPDINVKRETLETVALKGWRQVGDLHLRMRKLTVAKDGIVPTHQHDDRPSIVLIANGWLIEHSTFCSVPIVHRAGEVAAEFGVGHAHWWENQSGEEVVIYSTDVIPPEYFDPGTSPKHDM